MENARSPPEEDGVDQCRPPLPPFTEETALQKVQAAEDAWNTRDPQRVALAHTPDSRWRNRDEFITGREEIVRFLTGNWGRELDYALRKSLWTYTHNRIAVRFQYEWHDEAVMALGESPQGRSSNFPTLGGCHCSGRRVPVAA